jgi:hypothetical protein
MERAACEPRDCEGPSSKDMSELSGHKRKASPMVDADAHRGHNGRAPHAAGTQAAPAPPDRLQAALNCYKGGYFKGTHMPVDGWFQPCS